MARRSSRQATGIRARLTEPSTPCAAAGGGGQGARGCGLAWVGRLLGRRAVADLRGAAVPLLCCVSGAEVLLAYSKYIQLGFVQ